MNSYNRPPDITSYTTRPYQRVAIDATRRQTTALVRQSLEREDNPEFPTAALLEMATGS